MKATQEVQEHQNPEVPVVQAPVPVEQMIWITEVLTRKVREHQITAAGIQSMEEVPDIPITGVQNTKDLQSIE